MKARGLSVHFISHSSVYTHSVATYVLLERHMCHHSPKCVSVSLCFDVCDNTPAGRLHASLVSPGVSQHEGVAPARGRNDGERRWSYICKVNSGNYSPLCEQRVKYNICIRRWWKFTSRLRIEFSVCQISRLKGRWHDSKSHTFEFYLSRTRCSLFTLHLISMQKCHSRGTTASQPNRNLKKRFEILQYFCINNGSSHRVDERSLSSALLPVFCIITFYSVQWSSFLSSSLHLHFFPPSFSLHFYSVSI